MARIGALRSPAVTPAVRFASIRFACTRRRRRSRLASLACAAILAMSSLAAAEQGPEHDRKAPEATVSTHDLLARLNQPWVQLIDIRSAREYDGRDIRALRGGHIPGARNVPLGKGEGSPDVGTAFAPQLASLDRRKETIVYGHQGSDAAQVADWLKAQGFRQVRVYTGAWQTWGNRLELPAASERFADVAAMHERILELQRTVDRLSPRLAGR